MIVIRSVVFLLYLSKTRGSFSFLIHMSNIRIYVFSCVWLATCKTLNIGHYAQTFQSDVFIPAMLADTINFSLFTPHSVTFTMAGGHKAKPVGFRSLPTFQLSRMKFSMVLQNFRLNILKFVLREIL